MNQSTLKVLKVDIYWLIDCVSLFVPFYSYRSHQFPIKGSDETNFNHIYFKHTLFQALKLLNTWLTWQTLPSIPGHRSPTKDFHFLLSWAIFSIWPHVLSCCFPSCITDLLHEFLGLPGFLCPCGFHLSAWLTMVVLGFLRVCPIHVHFLLLIWISIGSWFALLQISSLVTMSCHFILRMLLKHTLVNVCSLCIDAFVIRQVSEA